MYGCGVTEETTPATPIKADDVAIAVIGSNGDIAEQIEALEAIGYVSGSEPAQEVPTGIIQYDADRAYNSLNIVNSSHVAEATLMTMDGDPLHRWRMPIHGAWPKIRRDESTGWRRVRIAENGDLFAVYSNGVGIIKIDKHSNLIWKHRDTHHHDIELLDDGSILSLTRTAHIVPRVNERTPILEDFIVIHAADGTQLQKVSLLECVENSMYWPVFMEIFTKTKPDGNIFHTNDVEMLDGRFADRNPAFAKGNVMVSILMMSAIAVIDLDQRKIVWLDTGLWLRQHNPSLLDNGNILVFDNQGRKGLSQVIEYNPMTQLVEWLYPPAEEAESHPPLFSEHLSTAERLPNGNTMIVESYSGRAIEVTADHEIVWEYLNPHRTGEEEDLIANLQQVVRLSPDFPVDWADATTVEGSN
jgi:hypothetical protein